LLSRHSCPMTKHLAIFPYRTLDSCHIGDGEFGRIHIHGLEHLQTLPYPLYAGADQSWRKWDGNIAMGIERAETYPGIRTSGSHIKDMGISIALLQFFP